MELFNVYATKTKNFYHKGVFCLVAAENEEKAKKIAKRYWRRTLGYDEEISDIRVDKTNLHPGVVFEY